MSVTKKDYYEILGVTRDVGEKELKAAYRRLARKYHPDVNKGDANAEEKFKEISEAFAVLSDSAKRAKYVVENFQEAPQTADALAIMTQAYERLELNELSEDAYRVLKLNYPDHPYITGRYESEGWLKKLWPFD